MSLFLGVLSAAVALDDSEYQKKLKGLETSSSDSFQKIAKAAASYLTVTSILNLGRQAIQTFSDLEESTNKFNVVFQGFSKQAGDAVDELTKKFGQSELSAKKMLSGTGDILTGFGFDRKLALDMSMLTAQLGSDLASFTNYAGGAAGATDALTKAMLGETESAKMLGIVIRQDSEEYKNLIQQAMTTGVQIKEGGEKIVVANEQQAKAVAALALAYQQSKNAHGDFLRSQDSIANQTQILKNNLEEVISVIGGDGASAYSDLLKSTNNLLKSYIELSPATRSLINNTALLTACFVALRTTGIIGVVKSAVAGTIALLHYATVMDTCTIVGTKMTIQQGSLQASMKATAVAASIATAAIGGAVAMLSIHYILMQRDAAIRDERLRLAEKEVKIEEEKLQLMRQSNSEDMNKLERLKELSEYQNLSTDEQKEADDIAKKLQEDYDNLSISIDKVNKSVRVGADAWKKMTKQQKERLIIQANRALTAQLKYVKALTTQIANSFSFGDMPGGINYEAIANGLQANTLNFYSELKRQLGYVQRIRNMLLEKSQKEEAEQLDSYIVQLEKAISLYEELDKIRKAKVTNNGDKKNIREQAFYELTEYEWQIKFDESDFDKQLKMLKEKADKTFSDAENIHYSSIDKLLAADTRKLSKKELELRKEILEIREKEKSVAEKVADQEKRQNEERRRYFKEERRRNIDIENARKAIKEFERQQYFDKSDDDTKLILLADRAMKLRDELEYIKSINDSSFSDQLKNAKEELRIKQELKEVEEQRGAIYRKWREDQDRKEQKERENFRKYSYENESFNDFLELRKKDKEVSKITKAVEELRSAGYNDRANAIIQKQLDYYKKQAIQLKKEFIVLSKSPNQIDDDYLKKLNSIRENMEKAFSDANYWQNRLDADKDLDRRHENARETIGAWSLAALSRMTGSSPEVQTAKNTRETSRKMTELLELEKKRPSLTF